MKSVLQAMWLLTVAFGNLIVVIIAEAKFFDRQSLEFFLFAGLMLVDMLVFALLARSYKYVDATNKKKEENEKKKEGKVNASYKDDDAESRL